MEDLRRRELDIAEQRAVADTLLAQAQTALATEIRESRQASALNHGQLIEKVDETGHLIRSLTSRIEAHTALFGRAIDFLSSKAFISGAGAGVLGMLAMFGPLLLASLPAMLAGVDP